MNLAPEYSEARGLRNYVYRGFLFHKALPVEVADKIIEEACYINSPLDYYDKLPAYNRYRVIFEAGKTLPKPNLEVYQIIGYFVRAQEPLAKSDVFGRRVAPVFTTSGDGFSAAEMIRTCYSTESRLFDCYPFARCSPSSLISEKVIYIGGVKKEGKIIYHQPGYDLSVFFETKRELYSMPKNKVCLEERTDSHGSRQTI